MTSDERFGVTADGFVVKGVDRIIADQQARARAMFGDDVDLTSGSALRKVLDAAAVGTHELWRALEAQYYSNFISTAQGPSLDLLGRDLGLPRRPLRARGTVGLNITQAERDRVYAFPQGTVVETVTTPTVAYRTTEAVTLTSERTSVAVGGEAVVRGPCGHLAAGRELRLDPAWVRHNLNLGSAVVVPVVQQAFLGGDLGESDADYRARLLGVPRTVWTKETLLAQVLDVNGVRDAAPTGHSATAAASSPGSARPDPRTSSTSSSHPSRAGPGPGATNTSPVCTTRC
jgi:uncharacterized phage protein gp47/JayE